MAPYPSNLDSVSPKLVASARAKQKLTVAINLQSAQGRQEDV